MRFLILTQSVDTEDPALGFFVSWLSAFAAHAESIEVVCLWEGKHQLPENVRIHSLGKERRRSRIGYLFSFYRYLFGLGKEYDAVFVHMNEEYVLLGGLFWKLMGKRIYMWRNHYAGSWKTGLAVSFCRKVFCTSKHSYTARYKKTVLMPVGVDRERFGPDDSVPRAARSILFLARMAPSKRPEILLGALAMLKGRGVGCAATFVGSPLPEHESYYAGLIAQAHTLGLSAGVSFKPGVPHSETPHLYRSHELFVNTSPSGMLDKTLFEAGACGAIPLAMSDDWAALAGNDLSFAGEAELSERLEEFLYAGAAAQKARVKKMQHDAVEPNSLSALADKLFRALRA